MQDLYLSTAAAPLGRSELVHYANKPSATSACRTIVHFRCGTRLLRPCPFLNYRAWGSRRKGFTLVLVGAEHRGVWLPASGGDAALAHMSPSRLQTSTQGCFLATAPMLHILWGGPKIDALS